MSRLFKASLVLGLAMIMACGDNAFAAPGSTPVASLPELDDALSRSQGKPALVRVRADWDAGSRELEKQLASGCLQDALSDVAWIEWDVTANTDADRQFLEKYEVLGPPVFLLFDSTGNYLKEQDVVGYLPAEKIVATLTDALQLPTNTEYAECRENERGASAQTWNELIDDAYEYLYARQEALEVYFGLREHDRWYIDQDAGTLTFSTGDVAVAEAQIVVVGTFIATHGAWRWSWANPSVDTKLSAPIEVVREYGAKHRLEKLTDRGWRAEEVDGWEMAAIANYLLKGEGVYRAPVDDLHLFVVIADIRKVE